MQHFKVHAPLEKLFFHLKSNIDRKDKKKVCILHTAIEGEQDIYISTEDEMIISILKERYPLEPCSSPLGMLRENMDKWMVRGNPDLLQMDS